MRHLAFAYLLLMGTACPQPGTTIQADDYDRSCTLDSDCVLMFEGSVCPGTCSPCPTRGINRGDQATAREDRERRARLCLPPPLPSFCGACPDMEPACAAGVCVARSVGVAPVDAGVLDAGDAGASSTDAGGRGDGGP